MEHGDGVYGAALARAAALGVVIDQQPLHAVGPSTKDGTPVQVARWGPRVRQFMPLRSVLAAGVPLAFSSDANAAEEMANPFSGFVVAVTHPLRPDEAVTREQALAAYTSGGAYAEREEASKGKIVPEMAADFAVLSQDILTAPLDAVAATTSLLTVVDGAIAHVEGPYTALRCTR
jgi:predicted amidohydrolase YtcJ